VQSGIAKPEQYEEIISNLINQRERLENDLKLLREKVVALQMKEAQKQASRNLRKRPSAAKQDVNYREEL
jgi:outer membrane murein-binding lipoprotein Lpp